MVAVGDLAPHQTKELAEAEAEAELFTRPHPTLELEHSPLAWVQEEALDQVKVLVVQEVIQQHLG